MSVNTTSPVASGRSEPFKLYIATSSIAFFLSYVATYAYSFYFGRMSFDSQFHAGSDFPGSLVDPAVHDPDAYNVGVHFFGDFWTTLLRSFKSSPYLSIGDLGSSSYPPFAHVFLKPFRVLPYPLALAVFLLGGTMAVIYPFLRALKPTSVPSAVLSATCGVGLTYPFLFAIDRGNNITLAVSCCLFALLFDNKEKHALAAIMFGLAAAIKVYPIVFLLIYSNRSKLRFVCIGGATAISVTLLSLLTFGGGAVNNATTFLTNLRSTGNSGIQVHLNHSLNGLIGTLNQEDSGFWTNLGTWLPLMNGRNSIIIFATVGLLILYLANVTDTLDFAPEIIAICCVLQTFFISLTYGYTLLIYLIVIQAIVLSLRNDWWARCSAVVIGLLFASKGIPVGQNLEQLLNYVNPLLQGFLFSISILSIGHRLQEARSMASRE